MNDYNINLLLMATKKSQVFVLKLLLEKNVDMSYKDRNGCNSLHIASNQGHYEFVEMMLKYWKKSVRQGRIDKSK